MGGLLLGQFWLGRALARSQATFISRPTNLSTFIRRNLCSYCCSRLRGQALFGAKCCRKQLLAPPPVRLQIGLLTTRGSSSSSSRLVKLSRRTPSSSSSGFFSSEMRRLLSLARPEKWNLAGALTLLLFSSAITMSVPFALGKVIDLIYTTDAQKMKQNLDKLTAVLFVIFLIGGACNFGRVYLMNISAQRITRTLRERVFNSIMRQEVGFFDENKTGELVNRLSADSSLVSHCVTMNISDGLRSLIMVAAGMSMMFYMSSELALVSLCIVPPIAAMAIIYGRFIRRMTTTVQDALADATQVAEERIANIRTVKAFSKEDVEIEKYQKRMEHVLDLATKESLARGIFFGMAGLSGNAIVLCVLYYGGVMVSGHTLSVGDLSAFLLYAAYIGVSLGGLTSFYSELNRGLGASTRLWQLIDRIPAIPVSGGLEPVWEPAGGVSYKGVVFCYPTRLDSQPVLRGLDLVVPSSTVTAVVGSSGSGKSTLASLLLRLYDPQAGTITLDGTPVHEYDPSWLRSHIGTVSQEPVLFSGTIKENILYGATDPSSVSEERLMQVMKEANAYNFVMKELPDGLNTLVGERGIMLSGGQKQRIAIARALIKNPKILLLDEATSALDAESEHLVQEALERIMKGRTVLTIAHRLSTIKNADQIAVLSDGKIVELGSYDRLMEIKDGHFRKLIKHQTFQLEDATSSSTTTSSHNNSQDHHSHSQSHSDSHHSIIDIDMMINNNNSKHNNNNNNNNTNDKQKNGHAPQHQQQSAHDQHNNTVHNSSSRFLK